MKDINRRAFIHQSAMAFLAAATLLGAGANAFAENRDARRVITDGRAIPEKIAK